jgi:putative membrane protein
MTLVHEKEYDEISAAIAEVERHTDAELVAVLAAKSDDYRYIPTLWAALMALALPFLLAMTPYWLDAYHIAVLQLSAFAVIALLFRWPPLLVRLIPKNVRFWRASNLARRQFLENNLHHTRGETGVLIFVSELEHYVEIIADRGIDQQVQTEQWQSIVDSLVSEIKKGRTKEGIKACIQSCGELLIKHVPVTDQKNELPNHLVVI